MKKKILIIALIILLSLGLGLGIRFLTNFIKNQQLEKNYTTFIGAVQNIDNNYIYVITEDPKLSSTYSQIYFSIPKNSEHTWEIGDKLEIKFLKDFISKDGYIQNTNLKYLGKTRLFNNVADIPVSNSRFLGGNLVFKSIYQYEENINLDDFSKIDNYLVKKIISYDEYKKYKELIPETRTLTEKDFVNYYLLIILSTESTSLYTLEGYEDLENSLSLSIQKHTTISTPASDKEPIFSGISVVVPNRCDFDLNNISLKTTLTK